LPPKSLSAASHLFQREHRAMNDQEFQNISCVIRASSHIIREVCSMSSAKMVPLLISHIVSSSICKRILNREWAVRPPGNSNDATPEEATVRTIFFSDSRWETQAFHKKFCRYHRDHKQRKMMVFCNSQCLQSCWTRLIDHCSIW
jgi:hypothetical protein